MSFILKGFIRLEEAEGEVDFPSLVHSLRWPEEPSLGQGETRNQHSIWVSHTWMARALLFGPHSAAFPGAFAGS